MHHRVAGAIDGSPKLLSPRSLGPALTSRFERPIHGSQEIVTFVRAVHRQSPPIAAISQICEQTGAIFMKVQKSLASHIKYSGPPLDEANPRPKAQQQIIQRL
jgi:hypothetical protein